MLIHYIIRLFCCTRWKVLVHRKKEGCIHRVWCVLLLVDAEVTDCRNIQKHSKKLNEWVHQVMFSFSPNTTPCFCRISGEADVTVWMQGQGVTRRRWARVTISPSTTRAVTLQSSWSLHQQSWLSVRLKWARCSTSLLNWTRRWGH